MLSFCCFKGFLAMIFVVASLKVILRALKFPSNRFENTSMNTAHVQPSGGHSDGFGSLWEAIAD